MTAKKLFMAIQDETNKAIRSTIRTKKYGRIIEDIAIITSFAETHRSQNAIKSAYKLLLEIVSGRDKEFAGTVHYGVYISYDMLVYPDVENAIVISEVPDISGKREKKIFLFLSYVGETSSERNIYFAKAISTLANYDNIEALKSNKILLFDNTEEFARMLSSVDIQLGSYGVSMAKLSSKKVKEIYSSPIPEKAKNDIPQVAEALEGYSSSEEFDIDFSLPSDEEIYQMAKEFVETQFPGSVVEKVSFEAKVPLKNGGYRVYPIGEKQYSSSDKDQWKIDCLF